MISKTLLFLGLFSKVAAEVEHLNLELVVEGGERQLFPLLPGTKCPTGHKCYTRTAFHGSSPMVNSLKQNLKKTLSMTMDWHEMDSELNEVVNSDSYCSRRAAMTRAAGLAAGLSAAAVSQPAYAAQTKEVQMGTDSGGLKFVPEKVSICKGDSVKWINNKGGPHNVVFDEDDIPDGVDAEGISMEDQLGEEGDTYVQKFDTAGTYGYYCEPHRGAGMQAQLVVA